MADDTAQLGTSGQRAQGGCHRDTFTTCHRHHEVPPATYPGPNNPQCHPAWPCVSWDSNDSHTKAPTAQLQACGGAQGNSMVDPISTLVLNGRQGTCLQPKPAAKPPSPVPCWFFAPELLCSCKDP